MRTGCWERYFFVVCLLSASGLSRPTSADEPAAQVKEVLVLHHSHLDVGYTHPQPMLWELEREFLDEALQLLDATADWPDHSRPRWTCEATAQVRHWLANASPADAARFAAYVRSGRIGISAWEYNTTPSCTAEELARQLYQARVLRERFGACINTANCHDVDGLPWTVVDLLADSGVELLIMAVNLHLGGVPQPRPGVFRWQGPSGRELLVMNGEHYTMFDQWLHPEKNSLDVMAQGLADYLRLLKKRDYPLDFIYLTSTHAPHAYDNSPPNLHTAQWIRRWNEERRQPPIRYVTPEELLARIRKIPRATLPLVRGDWTDFWNFGAASSAVETRITRNVKSDLAAVDLLSACTATDAPHRRRILGRVWDDVILYDEHTWGAHNALDADHPGVRLQWQHKAQPAYDARALVDYLLVDVLDQLAENPASASRQEGMLLVNPTAATLRAAVPVSPFFRLPGSQIRTRRLTSRAEDPTFQKMPLCGPVLLPPYSWKKVPLSQLKPLAPAAGLESGPDFLQSAFYRLTFDRGTGRIRSLVDRKQNRELLDQESPWSFFEWIRETPAPPAATRKAFFERNLERERAGTACWKPDWKAVRQGPTKTSLCRTEKGPQSVTLVVEQESPGVERLQQRITLPADMPLVQLTVRMQKLDVRDPEGYYLAFPLQLPAGWKCHFDTAGIPTALDAEQIPGTSRGWVTVDNYVSLHDGQQGVTLYCLDAPLVQVGDFHFGRMRQEIPRPANPLLLAWPLNNYWDTNFRASQPGFIELRYALQSHGPFDPAAAAGMAQQAGMGPVVHQAISCTQATGGRFFELQGAHVQALYVKRAEDNQGMIFRLVNLGEQAVEAGLTLPGRKITHAWLCSVVEENREPCGVRDGAVRLMLPPRQITTLRVR